ncbi:unnamed protein product [Closterium sp. NIES-65]|nr:unnamed protein product [Closterium sp. NIES-65]
MAAQCARSALQAGRCARSALQAAQCARSALQAGRCARSALQAGRCARSALQAGRCARSALQAGRCARSVLQAGRCARSALQAGRCACSALQAGQCACSALQAGRYARSALQAARCARSALQAAQCARSALQAGRCARSALQAAQCARSALHVAQCARSALQARRVASFLIPALFCRFPALYEERMTVAPPPASQPITDGHVAGQVGNGAARREARGREAREIASTLTTSAPHTHHPPPLITTLHLPPPPLPFIHLSPLLPSTHLCSPALTSAPLRSPLLPCAHLCSPALTSAPLRSPLLPCTHLCSPALTSAPLHSPLLPCTHLYCSPTFHTTVSPSPTVHAIVSPSPTVHAIVSPSPNVHTTVSPSPVVHTTVFSPLFTHLLFPLFPLFTPLPSPLARHAPRTHLLCSLPSPHSLIARNIQPGREAREIASTLTTSAPHTHHPPPLITTLHLPPPPLPFIHLSPLLPSTHLCSPALTSAPLRSPLLPCAHLCSPALTSAPLRSPLLPCAHLCSPALTSAPLHSSLLPCAHLCSPAVTSAPLRSPLLPCAHLCSPALTSAPLRSPLLPCAHLCSPALTSAPLHSPLLPCTHLCSPALTFTVHPLFTPPFPRPPLFMPLFPRPPLFTAIVSPSRNVHTTVSPSPVVHTTVFSPLFTHLLFPLFPLFTPLPSPLARHAPRTHLLCSLPPLTHCPKQPASTPCLLFGEGGGGRGAHREGWVHKEAVWEREVEHVSGGELQRFAVGVVGGQLGDRHLHVWEREVEHLSGGELQRFAIGVVAGQLGDIYMFDEPSSYLDVRQRLKAAQVIRSLLRPDRYVIVVEHDLSVLDYLSDFICCLYGKPGAYGVVTLPFSVREGINIFLAGFVPTENLRFRDESLTFRVAETPVDNPEEAKTYTRYKYPRMVKKQGGFKLTVEPGDFTDSQIVVMLGENGTGKTTFIRMLAGLLKADPDEETGKEAEDLPEFNVSYKPQKISPKFPHSVRALLHSKIRDSFHHPQFNTDVLRPMQIDPLLDQEVVNLSGGELQRVAITLCLGKPADIYLIDEPSAYLDSEQRIVAAKVIKRFILHAKKTAFVVEHDFIMATYLADRVIVYEGQPSVDCTARTAPHDFIMATYLADRVIVYEGQPSVDCTACTPQVAQQRHDLFRHAQGSCALVGCTHGTPFSLPFSPLLATVPLTTIVSSHPQPPPPSPPQQLDITFRRDPTNFRPRINKMDSVKDREQKNAGTYYYLDD